MAVKTMTKLEMMQLSQSLSDLYTGLETDLIANIAEYLAAGKIDSPTAQWKIQMLAQLGALDKSNIKVITEYAGIAPDMLTEVLETAALSAVEELEPGFQKLARNGIINGTEVPIEKTMARALTSYQKQTKQSLNMVNTVMRYKAKSAAQKIINDTAELTEKQSFINTLNKATGKVVTGAESRQAAMRQCIKEMSEKGIPAFVDKLGREWSPEAYINMDIRTTANNVAHQAQFERMEDYGVDLIEVSSHAGARPKCAKDQGKIFNRKNKDGYTTDLRGSKIKYYSWKKSSYGEPDGILGINCGHHIYPFIPGISYQKYFPYDEYDNQEQYKKVQGQRELERRVRKSKRECIALESVGDTEGLKKAKETLKTRQQALKQYCADNDLKYKPDRTAVVNYKKSVVGFAPVDKKKRIAEIKAKAVDNSGGSDIIKVDKNKLSKYIGKPIIENDNQHVREWYYANVTNIPNQIDKTKPFEEQVKQAFKLRNKYKHEARVAMADEETANLLELKRPAPTFEKLLKDKMNRKSMSKEEALRDILETAAKTNSDVIRNLGCKEDIDMTKYDYNIYPDNSPQKFKETCKKIEKAFPNANKRKLLIDVDGSTIQTYSENSKHIDVYEDYDIGAVFFK